MLKYAGVVLDYRDDNGETLKRLFPKVDDVPEAIKTARLGRDNLPDSAYALIASDHGDRMRRYEHHDAGTTLLSSIYFMEHGHKLPSEARKVACFHLAPALERFGFDVPERMRETLSENWQASSPVDISAGPAAIKVASAPKNPGHYAANIDGKSLYPIDTYGNIKTAESYWLENERFFHPVHRREFAVKLAARAAEVAIDLDKRVTDAGASTWAKQEALEDAMLRRKHATQHNDEAQGFLQRLFKAKDAIGAEKYAASLSTFDVVYGLDQKWGSKIPDPFSSTFGEREKSASEVVYEKSDVRVTDLEIKNLAMTRAAELKGSLSADTIEGMSIDPLKWFKGLSADLKHFVARLASDVSHRGVGISQIDESDDRKPKKEKDGDEKSSEKSAGHALFNMAMAVISQTK